MVEFYKLKNLPKTKKRRKVLRLLEAMEKSCQEGLPSELCRPFYATQLFTVIIEDFNTEKKIWGATIKRMEHWIAYPTEESFLPLVNHLRHELYRATDCEPAEWDLIMPNMDRIDPSERFFFDGCYVFAEDIRTPFNMGSIFRTAESFGVEKIFISEYCVSPDHARAKRTAMGCVRCVPWERKTLNTLPDNVPLLALETGGTAITDIRFPKRAVLMIGSEELGLSPAALKRADMRISIPMHGIKASLNVGVAFGICMQKWVEAITGAQSRPT